MLRKIVAAIGVSVMVFGGILPGHAGDRDKDDDGDKKGGHRAILNAVNSGNAQHGQLSSEITALSGGHQGILDAVNGGTSNSNTGHTTLQGEHATENAAHATQDAAHTDLSAKVDALQTAVDALSGGGEEGNHTLRWDQNLPAADRFVVLASFGSGAVLDKETGLVWEQSPATTTHSWFFARAECTARTTGGRKGWRLPSVHELASLVDPNGASHPFLPAGHPFSNAQSAGYWSATMDAGNPTFAWLVFFSTEVVSNDFKTSSRLAWCVRGGHNDGSEY